VISRSLGLRPLAVSLISLAAVSCGKKGPPLAPVRIAPVAVTELSARRIGDRVHLRFTLPDKNTDNSTPADVARVDVYALSVEKPADTPKGDEFLEAGARVASVTTKPGETTATAAEVLTDAALEYYVPETPARPAALSATPTATAAVPETPVPVRVYMVVPVGRRNHRGAAASTSVPLAEAPRAPSAPVATYSEKAISLTWVAVDKADAYNVYEVADEGAPVTTPLTPAPQPVASYEAVGVEFGKRRCYRVTSVQLVNKMPVESAPSAIACVTPVDTFAPAPPTGLGAVAGPGTISLIWDAVNTTDLAGYVVLRGTAPGDTLQALTPEPIKETTFRDATVTPGQAYVYAVVAVDRAKNMSAQSARIQETAR
jgi:hypothetical protein